MTISNNNILCIWYPSGGFGHFINAILTVHGKNYAGSSKSLEFSPTGDSHSFPLALPKYARNPSNYTLPELDPNLTYTVLVDNGINDESVIYKKFFPDGKVLKMCYSDWSWPIVARTMIEKAMFKQFSSEIKLDPDKWPTDEQWALREKYFLYLRDHPLRFKWKPSDSCYNIMIEELLDYSTLQSKLNPFGVADTFAIDWKRWNDANLRYTKPVLIADDIMTQLTLSKHTDLSITDAWEQAVVNYYIWLKYGIEVPANDYSNWFTNTDQIVKMLNDHGVKI